MIVEPSNGADVDRRGVGGKALSWIRHGFRVPPFFVVPASEHRRCSKHLDDPAGGKVRASWLAPAAQPSTADPAAQTLIGLSASPGSATGHARVVHDVAELEQVRPGEILVARQTDPGWTPVFVTVSGTTGTVSILERSDRKALQ